MNGLLAVVALVLAALSFWQYSRSPENTIYIVGVILFGLAFIAFGGLFLSGRVNKNDDVHITE
jgi:lipopolysaccharide export LptBFGC system permease protein LptF